MDERDEDVRGALATLLEPEPPMRTTVVDDVRRGRALRARHHRRLTGGLTAAVVVAGAIVVAAPRIVAPTPVGDLDGVLFSPQPPPPTAGMDAESALWNSEVWRAEERLRVALASLDYGVDGSPSVEWQPTTGSTIEIPVTKDGARYDVDVWVAATAQTPDSGGRICTRAGIECAGSAVVPREGEQDGVGSYAVSYVRSPMNGEFIAAERVYADGATVQLALRSADDPDLSGFAADVDREDVIVRMLGMLGRPDLAQREVWSVATTYPDGWVPDGLSQVPPRVEGEIARAVLSDAAESHMGTPDASITYVVQAACVAAGAAGSDLRYEIRDDTVKSGVLSSGSVPCDGTVVQNTASALPAHRLSLALIGPAGAQGWGVLVPYPSLAEQQKAQRKAQAEQDRTTAQRSAEGAATPHP